MHLNYRFDFCPDWRLAPLAVWVHVPTPDRPEHFTPPAPSAHPHRGYPLLLIEVVAVELAFSTLAQLDHFIEVLSRTPLPTSRQLSTQRGSGFGPNGHWLSRLPATLKAPRRRATLVKSLQAMRDEIAAAWP